MSIELKEAILKDFERDPQVFIDKLKEQIDKWENDFKMVFQFPKIQFRITFHLEVEDVSVIVSDGTLVSNGALVPEHWKLWIDFSDLEESNVIRRVIYTQDKQKAVDLANTILYNFL